MLKDGTNNKKLRAKRPWWTDELRLLWNDLCTYENLWLKCKIGAEKSIRKQAYVERGKISTSAYNVGKDYTGKSNRLNY